MNDFLGEFLGRMRESATGRLDDSFAEGFNVAANLCVGLLQEHIDGLLGRIGSEECLSEPEQILLSKLNQLKAETERELRGFWTNAGNA